MRAGDDRILTPKLFESPVVSDSDDYPSAPFCIQIITLESILQDAPRPWQIFCLMSRLLSYCVPRNRRHFSGCSALYTPETLDKLTLDPLTA